MKLRKMGWWLFFLGCMLLILAVMHGVRYSKGGALWQIVSQQCVPYASHQPLPAPCVQVDLDRGYVVTKDRRGTFHDLLLPVELISGLESDRLDENGTRDFMSLAWAQRGRLSALANRAIADQHVAVAINSRWGRTQDHLHVHIACLKPQVFDVIQQHVVDFDGTWKKLASPLEGQTYWARRWQLQAESTQNPIQLLNQHLRAIGKTPGDYGLAMVQLADGDFLLLATGWNLTALDLGSTERLQDFECQLSAPQRMH